MCYSSERPRRSFRRSFHQALLRPSGAHWLDKLPDLTCKGSTRQHAVDDPLLSCKQPPLASSSGASSKAAGQRLLWR
jgi:hypothetical protein